MAFRPPTFILLCDIYRNQGTGGTYGAPDLSVLVNLSIGQRSLFLTSGVGQSVWREVMFPKNTDVRGRWNLVAPDLLEIPSGSKRFYLAQDVEDVGKGFPNEYRLAAAQYLANGNSTLAGGPYPAPVPLP